MCVCMRCVRACVRVCVCVCVLQFSSCDGLYMHCPLYSDTETVLINSVLLNRLCVWILKQSTPARMLFRHPHIILQHKTAASCRNQFIHGSSGRRPA